MSNSLLFRRAFYSTLRCERRRSASCQGRIKAAAAAGAANAFDSRSTDPWLSLSHHCMYSTQHGRYWKTVDDKSNHQHSSATSFTLMSYNILAQHHIDSQPSLYHCHQPDSLGWPHRFEALKREINEISPDILCLQEVQQSHLTQIANHFDALDYDTSLYKKRTGLQVDGCAIFFKRNPFDLIEFHFVDYFQPDIKVRLLRGCAKSLIHLERIH